MRHYGDQGLSYCGVESPDQLTLLPWQVTCGRCKRIPFVRDERARWLTLAKSSAA